MQEVICIEGLVHLFGIKSSPPVSTHTFRHHIDSIPQELIDEWVCKVALNDFYVDDLLASLDKVDKGIVLKQQLNDAASSGGFNLCKW